MRVHRRSCQFKIFADGNADISILIASESSNRNNTKSRRESGALDRLRIELIEPFDAILYDGEHRRSSEHAGGQSADNLGLKRDADCRIRPAGS
jgi:hypothetical protein